MHLTVCSHKLGNRNLLETVGRRLQIFIEKQVDQLLMRFEAHCLRNFIGHASALHSIGNLQIGGQRGRQLWLVVKFLDYTRMLIRAPNFQPCVLADAIDLLCSRSAAIPFNIFPPAIFDGLGNIIDEGVAWLHGVFDEQGV